MQCVLYLHSLTHFFCISLFPPNFSIFSAFACVVLAELPSPVSYMVHHMKSLLWAFLLLLLATPAAATVFDGTIKVGVPLAGGKWARFSKEFMTAFHMVNAHVRETGGIPIGGKRYEFEFITYDLGEEVCIQREVV